MITLTQTAADQLQNLLAQRDLPDQDLRIFVQLEGVLACSMG